MFVLRRLLAPLLALLLPACATADARPASAAETHHGPAIWMVADKDTTIYLFGTIHALPEDKSWFSGPVERAYDSSQEVVTEYNTRDNASAEIAGRGLLSGPATLRSLMKPDDRKHFEEALVSFGVPVEALDKYKPWLAALVLTKMQAEKAGFDEKSGAEAVLVGKVDGKRQDGLETVAQQIDIFDGLPVDEQLAFLAQTVSSMSEASVTLKAYYAKWITGDADGLAALMNAELDDPLLRKRLLADRNARWAQWIDERLKQPGTVFIAVGAGHLAGGDSVQRQLQKRGLKVRRVWQ